MSPLRILKILSEIWILSLNCRVVDIKCRCSVNKALSSQQHAKHSGIVKCRKWTCSAPVHSAKRSAHLKCAFGVFFDFWLLTSAPFEGCRLEVGTQPESHVSVWQAAVNCWLARLHCARSGNTCQIEPNPPWKSLHSVVDRSSYQGWSYDHCYWLSLCVL